jgi:PhnB protein
MTHEPSQPIPQRDPNLAVDGGPEASTSTSRAFGAEVVRRLDAGGRMMYAELRIGDSVVTRSTTRDARVRQQGARSGTPVPVSLTIYCEDTDALYAQALEAGATQVRRAR